MAATALSISSPTPKPPLVASRRVEFRIAHNSFSRWKYGQVDCFIANTDAIRDVLVADGIPRAKIAIVNEGVDVERIVPLPAANVHAEFYLPTHAPVVGNVAALVPHKGQQHLIDAAALVVQQVPDVRFVILGDGELREQLERQIKHKHLERHVFLAGFRSDALELTKGFDVFVMSSVTEGMCTALVDAMAASKAAVATAAGGIPEVVVDGETGFLVPPRGPEAMAEQHRPAAEGPGAARSAWARRRWRVPASGSPSSGWSRRRTRSTNARSAHAAQRALRVALGAVEAARVHHADVAQREVEPHRIVPGRSPAAPP